MAAQVPMMEMYLDMMVWVIMFVSVVIVAALLVGGILELRRWWLGRRSDRRHRSAFIELDMGHTAHGLAVGDPVCLANSAGHLPEGLTTGVTYHVLAIHGEQVSIGARCEKHVADPMGTIDLSWQGCTRAIAHEGPCAHPPARRWK